MGFVVPHQTNAGLITWFRTQFPRKLWPIQSACLLFIVCSIFLSCLSLRRKKGKCKGDP